MNNERAIEHLKIMGYSEEKAKDMLASPAGKYYLRTLESMEDGIKEVMNNPNIDPLEFLKQNDSSSLFNKGQRRK